jgi:hypothetical protein
MKVNLGTDADQPNPFQWYDYRELFQNLYFVEIVTAETIRPITMFSLHVQGWRRRCRYRLMLSTLPSPPPVSTHADWTKYVQLSCWPRCSQHRIWSGTHTNLDKDCLVRMHFFWVGWDWVHLGCRPLFGQLYQPRMIDDERGAAYGMRIGKGNRSIRRKPVPVPLLF